MLQSDLDSHRPSVETITASAQDLLVNSSNARVAKRIESKLKDVQSRYEKLMDKSVRRGELLDEIAQALGDFITDTIQFDTWYSHMIDVLESRELAKLDVSEYETRMSQMIDKREDQRGNFEDLVRNGKNLLAKKDITDVAHVRDKIKALETQWKELINLLDEKQRLSKSRAEQLIAYEKLRDQVIDWLTRTETKVTRLLPVAVDLEILKKQTEELKPIHKEYRDYGNTVDKVNDLGMVYDSLLKERGESPPRRRGSTSPTKRTNVTSPRTYYASRLRSNIFSHVQFTLSSNRTIHSSHETDRSYVRVRQVFDFFFNIKRQFSPELEFFAVKKYYFAMHYL